MQSNEVINNQVVEIMEISILVIMMGSIFGIIGVPEFFINIFSTLIEFIMLLGTIGLFGVLIQHIDGKFTR